jgi:hypothetical protein
MGKNRTCPERTFPTKSMPRVGKKSGAREREKGRKEKKKGKRRREKERERLFHSHLVINCIQHSETVIQCSFYVIDNILFD